MTVDHFDRLFAYKLTHDTGFAPNPFHGFCTLATCKPQIRLSKKVGDWIAGFTSKRLDGTEVGDERLVYLMLVGEKLQLEAYHTDPRFAAKVPVPSAERCIETVGDNIYGSRDGVTFQVPNRSHTAKDIARDTGGRFALIATTFAYFGSEPLEIPEAVRPHLPAGQSSQGVRTRDPERAKAFIEFALSRRPDTLPRPTSWRRGDQSWQDFPR
ncbi:MAG: hypothetical protein ABL986_13965 [Vicinamibacterales bacterium]